MVTKFFFPQISEADHFFFLEKAETGSRNEKNHKFFQSTLSRTDPLAVVDLKLFIFTKLSLPGVCLHTAKRAACLLKIGAEETLTNKKKPNHHYINRAPQKGRQRET